MNQRLDIVGDRCERLDKFENDRKEDESAWSSNVGTRKADWQGGKLRSMAGYCGLPMARVTVFEYRDGYCFFYSFERDF